MNEEKYILIGGCNVFYADQMLIDIANCSYEKPDPCADMQH